MFKRSLVDNSSMDSIITVEDCTEEKEVIDINSSLSSDEIVCFDDKIDESADTEKRFSSDQIDVNNIVDDMTSNKANLSSLQSDDITSQPVFKIMFRDENVSRYELSYVMCFYLQDV